MTILRVVSCGPWTTIQDFGRPGWAAVGIPESGAMDRPALIAANALVGNQYGEAAIELGLLGGKFVAEGGDIRVAVCGARTRVRIDDHEACDHASWLVRDGETISIDSARDGVFLYLAIAGGIDSCTDFGSKSTDRRAHLGFKQGLPLATGDVLPIAAAIPHAADQQETIPTDYSKPRSLRVVMGPQEDYFSDEAKESLLSKPFTVSTRSSRMAYQLNGPPISWRDGCGEMISDATLQGSVQVPRNGCPLVMMADRQTVGGYPKIATIIQEDLHWLAQSTPGSEIRFEAISAAEAFRIAVAQRSTITVETRRRRRIAALPDAFALHSIADAVVDATDESTWSLMRQRAA